MTDKPKKKTVTVELTGNTYDHFDCVEEHMKKMMPGVKFDLASIARHAFYIAAKHLHSGVANTADEASGD